MPDPQALLWQQIMGSDPEIPQISDPEIEKREKLLWDKINKGPRERAKELAAQEWQDRYGLKETSGKGRRFLAGLAEMARGIGSGAKYESIPDRAAERGLKEYQAEVGPLQRELGVISQARTHAAKLAADTAQKNADRDLKQVLAMSRLNMDDAQIAKLTGRSEPEIAGIKLKFAQAGLIEARTTGQNLSNESAGMTNAVQKLFGGVKPTGDLSNAYGLNNMAGANPEQASSILDTAKFFKQATGKTSTAGGPKQTVRVPYMRSVTGWDSEGRPHIEKFPDEKVYRETIPGGGVNTSLQNAPPSWYKGTQRFGPTPPPGVGEPDFTPNPDGKSFRVTQMSGEEYNATPQNANIIRRRVDPSHATRLARDFEIPIEKFRNFDSSRFTDAVGSPIKEKTERAAARQNYYQALSELTRLSANAFASNRPDNISGLFENFENTLKAMTGNLPAEAIAIRQASIDAIATRILELSGKAVTNQERTLYMKSLPNLATDAPETFVAKSMILKHMLDVRQAFGELRVSDQDVDKLYSTRAGSILATMARVKFNKLEQLRTMVASGKPMTIGNKVYTDPQAAAKVIAESTNRSTVARYIKLALKEAGITDVIPLD